jgi:hypothetical protein
MARSRPERVAETESRMWPWPRCLRHSPLTPPWRRCRRQILSLRSGPSSCPRYSPSSPFHRPSRRSHHRPGRGLSARLREETNSFLRPCSPLWAAPHRAHRALSAPRVHLRSRHCRRWCPRSARMFPFPNQERCHYCLRGSGYGAYGQRPASEPGILPLLGNVLLGGSESFLRCFEISNRRGKIVSLKTSCDRFSDFVVPSRR